MARSVGADDPETDRGEDGRQVDYGELIPRLHAFYGVAPHPSGEWLKVRGPVFRAYAKMLPRLEAEKTLAEYHLQVAAGELHMKENAREEFVRELQQRAAGVEVRGRRAQPIGRMGLQAMGIKAVYHPKKKPHA